VAAGSVVVLVTVVVSVKVVVAVEIAVEEVVVLLLLNVYVSPPQIVDCAGVWPTSVLLLSNTSMVPVIGSAYFPTSIVADPSAATRAEARTLSEASTIFAVPPTGALVTVTPSLDVA